VAEAGDVGWFGAVGDGFAVKGAIAVGMTVAVAVTLAMAMAMALVIFAPVCYGDGGGRADAAKTRAVLGFQARLWTRLPLGNSHRVANVTSVKTWSATGYEFGFWCTRWAREISETGC